MSMIFTMVAPFTGAWIEIFGFWRTCHSIHVAPFTGAWIEIIWVWVWLAAQCVAPFTGAWIEIDTSFAVSVGSRGRSLHGSVD